MSHLPALEAGTRVTAILGRPAATMRYFNADLVSHEVALVVLGYTFLRRFAVIEFLERKRRSGRERC